MLAAFLLTWSQQLRTLDFQDLVMFLQASRINRNNHDMALTHHLLLSLRLGLTHTTFVRHWFRSMRATPLRSLCR